MISDSLNYLRTSEDWVETVLIGGILSLLGVFVVPVVFVLGYFVRVIRATMHGDETAPSFDDWGELGMDGLKAAAISLVYAIVPTAVAGLLIVGGVLTFSVGGNGPSGGLAALGGVALFVGVLALFVLGLLAMYAIPAAIANFAETGEVGAGFRFGELRPVLTSGKYFTAWVTGVAIVVAGSLVSGALNVVPFLGVVVGGFVGFYASVAAYYLVGRAWGDLREIELRETGGTPEERPAI
ncbi:DUF4013 domain-containing protein [Halopelagius longus]|uniref:DUF4013 domain-containing protein n=1 Tax=Halopelagius longus TaxID=1236180 RepID=A0A1H0ZBD7_9EURY|nr:DUF4013 domain-containing protein [Halopelagius longus]RDI72925.1 DUF4013 domain-containing protein [Halopelagius longus]SDQ24775.1 Protein of unknown function [Halopelagius longus]